MTDRPILFSGPMVRANQRGLKTETRRLLTQHNALVLGERWGRNAPWSGLRFAEATPRTKSPISGLPVSELAVPFCHPDDEPTASADCGIYRISPVVEVGDRLWVRETWFAPYDYDYRADGSLLPPREIPPGTWIEYDADRQGELGGKKRPGIYLPRWGSRLTLTVTDVRIQRVQDMTRKDAEAEGLSAITKDDGRTWKWGIPDHDGCPGTDDDGWPWDEWNVDPVMAYASLFDRINGAGSWQTNPWVCAISYRSVPTNIDLLPSDA